MITPRVILKNKYIPIKITKIFDDVIPPPTVFSKKTFESCPWAKDNAHKRRYEAVLDILPKINSIVYMIW